MPSVQCNVVLMRICFKPALGSLQMSSNVKVHSRNNPRLSNNPLGNLSIDHSVNRYLFVLKMFTDDHNSINMIAALMDLDEVQ